MKKILTVPFACLFAASLFAQPSIEWEKTYGGTNNDGGANITQTPDGGYFVSCYTESNDGDVSNNHGFSDAWAMKLDAYGAIQWQKTYGGSDDERFYAHALTRDGGYILGGYAFSSDGDLAGFPEDKIAAWLVKIDSLGAIQWQKTFYSGGFTGITCIKQTPDDGFVFCAQLSDPDSVAYLVKVNAVGELEWQKSNYGYGLSLNDLKLTPDGGYIAAGEKYNPADSYADFAVVRFNAQGDKLWERVLGGSKYDVAYSVQVLDDGGFIAAGKTESFGGDVTTNYGVADCWVIRLNEVGEVLWKRNYGGSKYDAALEILPLQDGGFLLTASTYSNDHDVLLHYFGAADVWVAKLDAAGELLSQTTLGGNNSDSPTHCIQTSDGGFVFTAYTASYDENVAFNHGFYDLWLVKLSAVVGTQNIAGNAAMQNLQLFPNPAKDEVLIQSSSTAETLDVRVSNLLGQVVWQGTVSNNSAHDFSSLVRGAYLVTASSASGEVFSTTLVKQ